MTVLIASSVSWTCLGDGPATFAALLRGRGGPAALRVGQPDLLRVSRGHHLPEHLSPAAAWRASEALARCVGAAVAGAGVDPARSRVACLVGTGLRESAEIERADADLAALPAHRLHFAHAVREAVPGIREVVTIANACSAGGHALALAQDMLELDEADAVVVAATDTMSESMLAMIGRVVDEPTDRVRPFDADRQGVLLGEGAAALVLVPDRVPGTAGADAARTRPLARLLATGLSCDAFHETAPSVDGIARAMRDAYQRAGRQPTQTALVVAHGTGTARNDPAECAALHAVLRDAGGDPLVTAVKGAVGHTSGAAALTSLDVAVRCLASGRVPPVVGLRAALPEAAGLRLVVGEPVALPDGLVQVDAFGFGGVNAVSLLEAVR